MESLRNYNTFNIEAQAESICNISSVSELMELVRSGSFARSNPLILGGGSNVLFTGNYSGTIYRAVFDNIKILREDSGEVLIQCDAGVNWDSFVNYCVSRGYGGLENLSFIPGSTGAAPIQNIGAYGSEVCNVIEKVNAVDLENSDAISFTRDECLFDYRSSIFKTELKGRVYIHSVVFRLTGKNHNYNTSYGLVGEKVKQLGKVNLDNIRKAVISIRKEKLPEPELLGNAGSFFKNPVIDVNQFKEIKADYKQIPSYTTTENRVKLPAAWLIESCGWKGYRKGDAGVHNNQALVLVNYGSASGQEIFDLSEQIILSVKRKFGIILEREVNVIG